MHLMRARQQLLAFLLRHGRSAIRLASTGRMRHRCVARWSDVLSACSSASSFRTIVETVWTAQERRDASDREDQCDHGCKSGRSDHWSKRCADSAASTSISAATSGRNSTGDLSRFESPRMLMGYLGLVPFRALQRRQYSPWRDHQDRATERPRRMLIEAAWSYQLSSARVAKEKAEILVRSAQERYATSHGRRRAGSALAIASMIARKARSRPSWSPRLARELAGFVWAIGQEMRAPSWRPEPDVVPPYRVGEPGGRSW